MPRLGIISDTHGLLRPEAVAFLQGSDRIVHGGDIGNPEILARLSAIAPLTVVRGNNDNEPWAKSIADAELFEFSGIRIYVLHDLSLLDIDPNASGIRVVISGHSNKPLAEERSEVLYLNPGSAGPRRFKLPITLAELIVDSGALSSRIFDLSA